MRSWLVLPAVLAAAVAIAILWRANGDDRGATGDPGPVHVHGLGVNPADGALFIATHTELYRLDDTSDKADRVGNSFQDTTGFTIVGSNRFLGSGHPDLRDDLPPLLGLVGSATDGLYLVSGDGRVFASRNAGRTIDSRGQIDGEPAALLADGEDELFVALHDGTIQHSADGGATWSVRSKP